MGVCCTKDLYKDDPEVWFDSQKLLEQAYGVGPLLGDGAFARVVAVTRLRDGALFAAKVFKKHMDLNEANELSVAPRAATLRREIDILRRLAGSAHCVKLRGVLETPRDLYLLLECCAGGDLMHHIAKQDHFTPQDAARYFSHFCRAVAHCHGVSVAHLDVKPENLLVSFDARDRSRVVLSDFGSAVEFAEGDRYDVERGSPFWSSPEAWNLDYDYRSDVYACGVVLLVMVDGMVAGNEIRALHARGLAGLVAHREEFYRERTATGLDDPELFALLSRLLAPEADRVSAAEALECPWLTRARATSLANPATEVLQRRAAERAARAALVTVVALDARVAVREALARSKTLGLPADCVSLGDLLRAAQSAASPRLEAALAALHPDPDLVLVHRPFALEALNSQNAPRRLPRRADTTRSLRPAAATDDADAERRAAPPRRAKSSDHLASLVFTAPLKGDPAPVTVGRKGAPGAGAADGAISMDGTCSGTNIFNEGSLHSDASFRLDTSDYSDRSFA